MLTKINDYWYDLSDFDHPGGDFIKHFNTHDATHVLYTSHLNPEIVIRKLRRYRNEKTEMSEWGKKYSRLNEKGAFDHPISNLLPSIFNEKFFIYVFYSGIGDPH
jgi:cytochrome b involved in lipid metabolism